MRTTRRELLRVSAGTLAWLAAGPRWAWAAGERDASLKDLADRAHKLSIVGWPAMAYALDPAGYVFYDDSEAAVYRVAGRAKGLLAELNAIPRARLGLEDQLLYDQCRRVLDELARAADDYYYSFTLDGQVSPLLGAQPFLADFPLDTPERRERYRLLVREIAQGIDAAAAKTQAQLGRGIVPPLPVVDSATKVWQTLAETHSQEGHFLMVSRPRLATLDDQDARIYSEGIARLIETEVRPAIRRLVAQLGPELRAKAPADPGLGRYPGGMAVYQGRIRSQLGVDITPEKLHQLGLERVKFYRDEIARLQGEMGYKGDPAQFDAYIRTLPGTVVEKADDWYPLFDKAIACIKPKLPQLFAKVPETPAGFARMPANLEATVTYGWFEVATELKPRGTYYFNGTPGRLLISASNLAFHELLPGHHFQFEMAKLGGLHPIQSSYSSSFYTEGYAEYATVLAEENGCYAERDLQYYGHLSFKTFMASRLVLDTGMNALGWSLEKARAYMSANTSLSQGEVDSETVRYSARMPGQALGYHFGLLKLLELREGAKKALGSRFDLKAFHSLLLDHGDLPYATLKARVDAMVAAAG